MTKLTFTSIKGIAGCAAVLTWLALFGAGLLIDSKPYREELQPQQPVKVAGLATGQVVPDPPAVDPHAFLACVLFYTPLNVALLTLLAGFVGGCTSSLTYAASATQGGPPQPKPANPFLIENPLASMLRSFLVFLAVTAGVYITGSNPFSAPTADQYVRFAGTVSFLAFGVGYDPTRLAQLVKFLPQPKAG